MQTASILALSVVGVAAAALIGRAARAIKTLRAAAKPKLPMSVRCNTADWTKRSRQDVHAPWAQGRCRCNSCTEARQVGGISTKTFCWCTACRTNFKMMRVAK